MFFVIQRKDWKDITTPEQKPDNCYDEYGISLIAVLVDVKSNKLLNSTSRWNHVVLPKSGAADTMFENWQQLNKAVKLDVESICRDECKELREKLQQKLNTANEVVAKILKNAKIITDVTVPKEFHKIMTEINIPFGVESIGDHAFLNCTSLKSIIIPDSVESIGSYTFAYCTSLKHITIPGSVKSIGDGAFACCTSLKSIIMPNSIESIKYATFYNCESLKNITIPDSVKSIGDSVFEKCISLKNIAIPNSIKHIGRTAFGNCKSLRNITLPDIVESIEDYAFYRCTSLKEVIFKGKMMDEVKAMDYYPWGIKDISIIRC